MCKLEKAITKVVIELIENKAVLAELERSFSYLDGGYYYTRRSKVSRRVEELKAILKYSKIGYSEDAPIEQYLVTKE